MDPSNSRPCNAHAEFDDSAAEVPSRKSSVLPLTHTVDEGQARGHVPTVDALTCSLVSLVDPIVCSCEQSIQKVIHSQAVLSQEVDRVASELQTFMNASALPSFAPHVQRLAEIRRRVIAAHSTLHKVQARLLRLEEYAETVEHHHMPTTASKRSPRL